MPRSSEGLEPRAYSLPHGSRECVQFVAPRFSMKVLPCDHVEICWNYTHVNRKQHFVVSTVCLIVIRDASERLSLPDNKAISKLKVDWQYWCSRVGMTWHDAQMIWLVLLVTCQVPFYVPGGAWPSDAPFPILFAFVLLALCTWCRMSRGLGKGAETLFRGQSNSFLDPTAWVS